MFMALTYFLSFIIHLFYFILFYFILFFFMLRCSATLYAASLPPNDITGDYSTSTSAYFLPPSMKNSLAQAAQAAHDHKAARM